MKIVSVMTTQSAGGGEFAAIEMLDALRDRGHDVVMLSDAASIGRDTAVRVRPIELGPKLAKGTWVSLMLRWPALWWRLRGALRSELPYDVLIVHYKKEQLLAAMLPARLRATIVWAEWGKVPFQFHQGPPHAAYLAAARRAALVMCVSQGTHDSVVEQGVDPDKVTVVPNVLRTDEIGFSAEGRASVRAALGIPAEAFVVGCISRFHPKKRIDVLVRAVLELEDPRVHLVLAGDGETEPQLRELAAPLGERAHFVPTPRGDVADVLSCFDVSVFCPSPTEGAPRAVILGMLASRPCLSTGPEGVDDMIVAGTGGIASPAHDPAATRALLEGYVGDPDRVAREGAAGRARAESVYAAPVVAAEIERLLGRARARPPAGGNGS